MAEERRRPEQLQHRLEQLIRAGIRINAERELRHVLQEVADAAREVIGARYTALGVLNPEGTGLGTFVASGLMPEEHARIGALPQGKGWSAGAGPSATCTSPRSSAPPSSPPRTRRSRSC
ncbi:MAG: hypothetical protein HYW06_09860 [Gemmatimonadetes bacterium]|nr:hypothetical protein [Gemmatimonadota bacterium]